MRRDMILCVPLVILCFTVTTNVASARDNIRTERVQFSRGAISTTVKGTVRGYQVVDYLVRAAAGQRMSVILKTRHRSNYFNVLPPGSKGSAIFVGSARGNRFTGSLKKSGDYRIRVYLMRSSARRDEIARYTLSLSIAGTKAQRPKRKNAGARAGRGQFDATGKVPCATALGQPMAQCSFGVARDPGGVASVVITRPDGRKRFIFFQRGRAVGADVAQSEGKRPFTVRREGDLNSIRVGPERYEIPDAVVKGG